MADRLPSDVLIRDMARALMRHGTSEVNALSVSNALCQAQIDGQLGHGLSRLHSYCKQAESGKVDGLAKPNSEIFSPSIIGIDAASGFAFPALDLAISELARRTGDMGFCVAAISRSHHHGVAGWHVERLAREGFIGFMIGNSPAAIAPWGGSKPLFGTNPIACAFPLTDDEPLVIDLSLSQVARGKVMLAAKEGRQVPEGWGVDKNGHATTSPEEILEGSMLPIGGAKGSALALMIELMVGSLTRSNFGFEAGSFFTPDGVRPHVGQVLISLSPSRFGLSNHSAHVKKLTAVMLEQEGVRLPGTSRIARRQYARKHGVEISQVLLSELRNLTQK